MNLSYFWYILLVRGGKEKEVITKIQDELEKTNSQEKVADLRFLPKNTQEKSLISGYTFCYCSLDEELVQLIYSIPGVIVFLNHTKGEKTLPTPLSPQKAADFLTLLQKAEKGEIDQEKEEDNNFKRGDLIKVVRGIYADCQGEITEIEPKKNLVIINVDFLGRLNPIKVLLTDCLKIKKS
ncbi:MAG: transcription antitermination protein NusG [Mycoplasmataceae bacterium CE_OT135]|nr:MAG: transcription antitermination protein NusG [Mycoplasmataceae bacterium CE_OT135]KLL03717.1 MAG: transcription antitermination protein NusG [Mycoplasmataceae bacterium CE_OT135]